VIALGSRLQPDVPRVAEGCDISRQGEAILVTHGHFDHLLDVPTVMSKTHARLIASASAVHLAKRVGAPSGDAVAAGDVRRIGTLEIRVLAATHERLFGKVPFDQPEAHGSGPHSVLLIGSVANAWRFSY
jgi:Predicted Zn-dependent hydrolases of the beta-lactamase fold